MPLTGEYEPSSAPWARDTVEAYERSGGVEGGEAEGRRVIILTWVGAKTGSSRSSCLSRQTGSGG
jgi:F420H(2)-dependent quinone reductase